METIPEDVTVNPDVTKDAAITPRLHRNDGETIYLTDGELIPWKSNWWRVRLREINGEKLLTLVKVKPTAASERRSQRAERWNEQHAKRSGVKRELRAMSRLIRGAGALSGSQASQQVQA
jgi:hypothetical protein